MTKYPLQNLITIKKKRLEEAERFLIKARKKLEEEEVKLKKLEKEREEVNSHRKDKLKQLREKLDEGTTTDKIQIIKRYLNIVTEKLNEKDLKVKNQLKQVQEAKKSTEEARKNYIIKQQDVEKLNIHKKEWKKEMESVIEHKLSIESDELGGAMHIRKKRN